MCNDEMLVNKLVSWIFGTKEFIKRARKLKITWMAIMDDDMKDLNYMLNG